MWSRLRLRKISVTDRTGIDEKGGRLTLLSMMAGGPPPALQTGTPRSRDGASPRRRWPLGALRSRPARLGAVSINVWITAVRKLAVEAADNGLLAPELANGITGMKT
jgi:hypothetical protein